MSAPETMTNLRYGGRVTIVAGGSSGIGAGIVRVFVQNGSKVVFCGKDDAEGIALAEDVNCGGPGEAQYIKCDMTVEDDIKNFIQQTVDKYGKIDCLINNVGAHPTTKRIDDFTSAEFQRLFQLNVLSHFLASKYALPHLRKTRGNIISNSSLVGTIGQPGAVTYCATKGAVSAMTRALAIDEAADHVRVNAFSPSNIWTPLWEEFANQTEDPAAAVQRGKDEQLVGRFGTPEECGQLCLFLAAEATFMTGLDVPISGGAELSYGNKNRINISSN